MHKIVLLLFIVLSSISVASQDKVTLTYIGNMGVHIANGSASILIDGLHERYGDDYLFPAKDLVHRINTKLRPDALIFTHYHGDHFSEQLSKEYLRLNKKALLYGPGQITGNFKEYKNRSITVSTKDYTKQFFDLNHIKIMAMKINHAGKRHTAVENAGYIITLSNKKILHVGDTNWMEEIHLFEKLNISDHKIDIAILPYWMLMGSQASELIKKHINPKQVIATHISPKIKKEELQALQTRFPKAYFLTKSEQQIQL